jgi:uncharacterized protein YegL
MATKVKCLPVYILIDTSSSMKPAEETLNESIENLYNELILSPAISDFVSLSILSYNTEPEVDLEMTQLTHVREVPEFDCAGVTAFGKALTFLRRRIDTDIPHLTMGGRRVMRPVVFLLTDGRPTDDEGHPTDTWRSAYRMLVDESNRRRPHVVPFGYGNASEKFIAEVGTIPDAAFVAEQGTRGDALRALIPTLLHTLTMSAVRNELQIPTHVDGFRSVGPSDYPDYIE